MVPTYFPPSNPFVKELGTNTDRVHSLGNRSTRVDKSCAAMAAAEIRAGGGSVDPETLYSRQNCIGLFENPCTSCDISDMA